MNPYGEGYDGYYGELCSLDNPYEPNTADYEEWLNGYYDAQYEELEATYDELYYDA